VLILLWLACTDPEFAGVSDAMSAYTSGEEAMEAGLPLRAAAAFSEAAASDPERPVLRGWQAWALDQAGQPEAALEVLDSAIEAHPDAVDLRYNRAAIRARLGELEMAASDLRALYAQGAAQPLVVGDDRDFRLLAADPEWNALVPTAQVRVELRGEAGAVVLGEWLTLHLDIIGRSGAEVTLQEMGEATGLLHHIRTVEDVVKEGDLWSHRSLRIVYRTVAEGKSTLGPWLVRAGGTTALTERIKVEVVALPGKEAVGGPEESSALILPSSMDGAPSAPWIGLQGGTSVARLGPRHTLSPPVRAPAGPVLELWSKGQVQWRQVPLPSGEHQVLESGRVVAGGG